MRDDRERDSNLLQRQRSQLQLSLLSVGARPSSNAAFGAARTRGGFILAEKLTTSAKPAGASSLLHYSECSPLKIMTGSLSGDPETLKKHRWLTRACVAAPSLTELSGTEQLALKSNSRFEKARCATLQHLPVPVKG